MIDFIINTKSLTTGGLVIRGTATTNHLDKHGESITISPNAFKNAYKSFIDKGGKIMAEHGFERKYGNRQLGNVLNMEYSPEDYSIDSPKPLEMKIDVLRSGFERVYEENMVLRHKLRASERENRRLSNIMFNFEF